MNRSISVRRGLLAGAALLVLGGLMGLGLRSPVATATPGVADPFPESWFYLDRRTGKRYPTAATLEGKAAPILKITNWLGEPLDFEKAKGKVIVVDFWATWCPPCVKALPKSALLYEKYKDRGVVFLGVHDARRGTERIERVATTAGVTYPTGVDDGGVSTRAWKIKFWPTYSVIDPEGVVRASGLHPDHVEDVIKALLEEKTAAETAP